MAVVALVTDLFFATKVRGTAEALSIPLTVVRGVDGLCDCLRDRVQLAIVDMNANGCDSIDAIRVCKSAVTPPRVLAFLSHAQLNLANEACEAGADVIMPRSEFSAKLPGLLRDAVREF
jgi:DNA-binding NarL/FixJ family response regulator